MAVIIPPDYSRCQAERPNGAGPFTCGGRHEMVRCSEKPKWLATEKRAGADGEKGSMTLCAECRSVIEKQMPGYCDFVIINVESEIPTIEKQPIPKVSPDRRPQKQCRAAEHLIRELRPQDLEVEISALRREIVELRKEMALVKDELQNTSRPYHNYHGGPL